MLTFSHGDSSLSIAEGGGGREGEAEFNHVMPDLEYFFSYLSL